MSRINKFDWNEYLDYAKDTFTQVSNPGSSLPPLNDEAKLRATISRAYYAVFNLARSFANSDGTSYFNNNAISIHEEVIQHFNTKGNQTRRQISTNLQRLKQERIKADYKTPRIDYSTADLSIRLAEQIQAGLEQLEDP